LIEIKLRPARPTAFRSTTASGLRNPADIRASGTAVSSISTEMTTLPFAPGDGVGAVARRLSAIDQCGGSHHSARAGFFVPALEYR